MFQIQIIFLILSCDHLLILKIIHIMNDTLFLSFVIILNLQNSQLHEFHFHRLAFDVQFVAHGISFALSQGCFLFLTKFHLFYRFISLNFLVFFLSILHLELLNVNMLPVRYDDRWPSW
jgi:hypothetical protein